MQKSTKVLRNPGILEVASADREAPNVLDQSIVDELVKRLRADIIEASQVDTMYSPQSDIVRHVHGDSLMIFVSAVSSSHCRSCDSWAILIAV